MKAENKRNLSVGAIFLVMLFIHCGPTSVSSDGGSGTGVGNGVVLGKVIYSDSTPVANAIVRLRTYNYLADTSGKVPIGNDSTFATVYTDAYGIFHIDSVDTHYVYCIEVNDEKSQAQATLYIDTLINRDTLKLETRVVKPVTEITGGITLNGLPINAYIQIYGLEKIGRSDSTGKFTITDLPQGDCEEGECNYRVRITTIQTDGSVLTKDYSLEIENEGGRIEVELELGDDDEGDD